MATLPKLPKCPKCGVTPNFFRDYYVGGDDDGCIEGVQISLICNCTKFRSLVPYDCYLRNVTVPMGTRETRTMRKMARQWKEYVKENSDDKAAEGTSH